MKKFSATDDFFSKFCFFKKVALVKVVQNEKFEDKNYCQNFDSGKNNDFDIFRSLAGYYFVFPSLVFAL